MATATEIIYEKKTIYITSEKVMVNLLRADKKKYLSISRLYRFVAFLRQELEIKAGLPNDREVVFNINFDAIERTVQYNNNTYDLIGDKIFLKGTLPSLDDDNYEDNEILSKAAQKFSEQYVA